MALSIQFAATGVAITPVVRTTTTIKDSAPNWAKDAFYELQRNGYTLKDAVNKLRASPFFDEEWLQE
ncbi:MAG: hypothetical protein JXR47_05930 [Thiotrichales bacterium]|nr:hypothetical protein [Thiotrichales bacterium]